MKSKTRAALLLVAIFVLGGIAGGVAQYTYQNHLAPGPPPRTRIQGTHDITGEMAKSLNLDAGQKEKLGVIIRQSAEGYSALSQQFRPQYEKIRSETNDAIRKILRPDQLKHFEETLERMDSRHRDHTHDPAPAKPSK